MNLLEAHREAMLRDGVPPERVNIILSNVHTVAAAIAPGFDTLACIPVPEGQEEETIVRLIQLNRRFAKMLLPK